MRGIENIKLEDIKYYKWRIVMNKIFVKVITIIFAIGVLNLNVSARGRGGKCHHVKAHSRTITTHHKNGSVSTHEVHVKAHKSR